MGRETDRCITGKDSEAALIKPIVGITGDIDKGKYSIKMAYADAVEEAGAYPVFLPPSFTKDVIKKIAKTIDALLISGGRDIDPVFYGERVKAPLRLVSPGRFHFEKSLLKETMILRKPVLGICYGMQFLNVFLRGTLYYDLAKQRPDTINHNSGHNIEICNKSKLYYMLGVKNIMVNSTHHQGIKRLGKDLIASAHSQDNLVEAIELKNYHYFIGVQWHPERLSEKHSQKLFGFFVNAVRAKKDGKR